MSNGTHSADAVYYCAFISYSRADRAVATEIQSKLERFVLPRVLRLVKPGLKHDKRALRTGVS